MAGVMIVTGGSRGIGAAIARESGRRGWHVCVNYRRHGDEAEAVAASIAAAGGTAVAVPADVGDEADVTREQLEAMFDANAFGPFLCAREAVRRMSTARGGDGGVIVNISSIAAVYGGMPGDVIYAGTKAAVDAMTMGLAREVGGQGIRVCGVRPGLVATDLWHDTHIDVEQVNRHARSLVPLGRVGTPEEIAHAVLWLCSEDAAYVTGTMLDVSGGREIDIPPAR